MTQPEALRLADALEAEDWDWNEVAKAAAELRRLHADNEKKSEAIQRLWKERDELRDSNEANAHLIAAAPDLLRELQILAGYAERNGARVGAARAAIAKAEGKT